MFTTKFSLGANPVDPTLAFRAAVESSLDVVSSINECAENSRDFAKNVTITFNGNASLTTKGQTMLDLSSVTIEDDGSGMDFATLYEKFRGAYYNSVSHDRIDQSGRNGVGVKTNLQYWNEVSVRTTTRNLIPDKNSWKCNDHNRDQIDTIYRQVSSLKPEDPDTEERRMMLCVDGSDLMPFRVVNRDDAYTVVELSRPRQKITLSVDEFIRKQSHCIEWLIKPNNKIVVQYKNDTGKWVKKEIRPFYEVDGKDKFICHVKGRSNEEMFIHYHDQSGTKKSQVIPISKDLILDPIEIDIKVLDKETDDVNPNDFVISICGATVYDMKARSGVSSAIEYLLKQYGYKSSSGFGYRLHGYIKTSDEHLKKALRHNKSVLDEEDRYSRMLVNYLTESILKPLNLLYFQFVNTTSDKEDHEIIDEIKKEFNNIMVRMEERRKQKRTKDGHGGGVEPKHKEYKCSACGLVWKIPLDKNASYCAEFNVSGEKGCGSRDIARNTHAKTENGLSGVNFQWVKTVGSFLPARYEEDKNIISLSKYHPSFIVKGGGVKARLHKITVGLEQAFFSIASFQSMKESKPIDLVYGECLREWFENKSNMDPLKVATRKIWRENNITMDQI